ncbi:MAG: DUF6948 domain-containing protein [Candidatus Thorarchaeota archaeon]
MDINDLTLGEIIQLQNLFSNNLKEKNIYQDFIGKYVICRTRNEGINAGVVVNLDSTGIILKDARRIYYHRPKDTVLSWYEGVARSGLSEDSKISSPETKLIIEDYSLTLVNKEAEKSIREFKTNEQ